MEVGMKLIAAALAKAQIEMGPALKDSVNLGFKSKYADLASVLDACLPALNKHGIAMIQPTGEDEHGRYVKTVLIHESGETLECRVPLIIGKNDMQGYGSAVTYGRRYGAMSMAGIAPEDDDGNAAAKAAPEGNEDRGLDPAQIAADSLSNAETLEALASIWRGLPASVKSSRIAVQAKDARKAALTPPITEDEIPY
jgi:ERF superfamily